jgi:hypothetical protein
MADLPETENYDAGVYQLETTDAVVGGASGKSNAAAINLANRTKWLKARVDELIALAVQATESALGIAEIATQAETNAGTDDERIVTPKKLRNGFVISWGDSGFIAFPSWLGGFIFQWVHDSIDNTTPSKLITLPTTFTQMIGATRYGLSMAHHFNSSALGNSPMLVSSFVESLSKVRVTKNTSGIGETAGNVSIYVIGR